MAISASSRNVPPLEVHGTSRYPLGMPDTRFLRYYWQKHPLLIRGAFPHLQPPIAPDDLAGLACEEAALARLIVHDPQREQWQVRHGPFAETVFAELPATHWTLLVQDVDKWDADVAALLAPFAFLPSWRIDDIMVSYAEQGGGVGAHVDHYDVFLLQGLGTRRWAISNDPQAPQAFKADLELKQLQVFEPTHCWVLEPGDMLYLPPGVPHDGVADAGPCMTFSIGMRAPSQAELIGDLADYLAEQLPDEQRYTDPDLAPVKASGEIDRAALRRVQAALPLATSLDPDTLADWFGRFITRYRSAQLMLPADKPLSAAVFARRLDAGAILLRHPWTRLAWSRSRRGTTLYASGQAYACPAALAEQLCAQPQPNHACLADEAARTLLLALLNDGHYLLHKPKRRA